MSWQGFNPVREALKSLEFQLPPVVAGLAARALPLVKSPYRSEFDELGCIFIHVPKTAGTSLARAKFNFPSLHIPALRYRAFDPDKFERYFKFSLVRNPFERLYSAYMYLRPHVGNYTNADKAWASDNLAEFATFEDFVLALRRAGVRRRILRYVHFRPQIDWLRLPPGNRSVMDFLGRFETLEEDYETIGRRLGVKPPEMPRLKAGDHPRYQDVYTEPMKQVVGRIYRTDLEALGYGFE